MLTPVRFSHQQSIGRPEGCLSLFHTNRDTTAKERECRLGMWPRLRHSFGGEEARFTRKTLEVGEQPPPWCSGTTHLSPDYVRAAVERMAKSHSEGGTGTKTGTERIG
jgi:hypothetical protein